MKLTPDDLVASKRGRQFCFDFASFGGASTPYAAELVQAAAQSIEDSRGRDGSRYWRVVDEDAIPLVDDGDDTWPEPPSVLPIAKLGVRFETIDLAPVTSRNAFITLARCVDEANYWEEPNGLDVVLGDPLMRPGLRRIAEHLLASAETDWWSTPLTGNQWVVEFTDGREPMPERPLAEEAHRLWIADGRYDWGWWSKPAWSMTSSSRSIDSFGPINLTLVEDTHGWAQADVEALVVARNARVFEILDGSSWAQLCRDYPLSRTAVREWTDITGYAGSWVIPNWSRMARDYDAVHLTVSAYLAFSGEVICIDESTASLIGGWEPDLTYWLTDVDTDRSTRRSWSERPWADSEDGDSWGWRAVG